MSVYRVSGFGVLMVLLIAVIILVLLIVFIIPAFFIIGIVLAVAGAIAYIFGRLTGRKKTARAKNSDVIDVEYRVKE